MIFKNVNLELKDIDNKQGIIKAYVSVFGNKDSDGDIIQAGAYKQSINVGVDRIKHLLNHDTWQLVGKPLELIEDGYGLLATSQLTKATIGRDLLIMYEEGLMTEHSVGFQTMKSEQIESGELIKEVKLWEFSSVTWGANPLARTVDVKQHINHFDELEKILKRGDLSDEFLQQAEQLHKALGAVVKHSEQFDDNYKEYIKLKLNRI